MNRSWVLTSPPSAPEQPAFRWVVINRQERLAYVPGLALLLAWFAYTRLYFFLHPRGLTFDPSFFMYLTGKPDPTCGLTRTFAWAWRGDLGQAVHVYPLGPFLFVIAVAVVAYLGIAVIIGRRLSFHVPRRIWLPVVVVSVLALAANWTAKLIWLGM